MSNNPLSPRQLAVLIGVCLVFLPICAVVYSGRDNAYSVKSKPVSEIELQGSLKLKNWLTPESYNYTLARLQDYSEDQENIVDAMAISGDVKLVDGAYRFKLTLLPAEEDHDASVLVNAFGSVVSTSVAVDGLTQNIAVNDQKNGADYSGLDDLIDQGLSSVQANSLQDAFNKFKPDAYKVVIDSTDTNLKLGEGGNPDIMTFDVVVNNITYKAKLSLWGITATRLILNDSSGQQVFDSGRLE